MQKMATLALSLILFGCETENTWWDKDALRKSLAGTYSTSWTTQGEDTRQLSLILEDQMVKLPQVGDALPFSLSIDGGSPLEGYLPLIALSRVGKKPSPHEGDKWSNVSAGPYPSTKRTTCCRHLLSA